MDAQAYIEGHQTGHAHAVLGMRSSHLEHEEANETDARRSFRLGYLDGLNSETEKVGGTN